MWTKNFEQQGSVGAPVYLQERLYVFRRDHVPRARERGSAGVSRTLLERQGLIVACQHRVLHTALLCQGMVQ